MQYLRGSGNNTSGIIKQSYDLQAGSYWDFYSNNKEKCNKYYDEIVEVLMTLQPFNSIIEAGIGDGTTANYVMSRFDADKYGFDISRKRLKFVPEGIKTFQSDLKKIKLNSNSIDIVYTAHSIEPNRGFEADILSELYRVAKKYLVLFEPIYELGTKEQQQRMDQHKYCRGLLFECKRLGYNVIEYRKLKHPINKLNWTGVLVVKK